MSLSLNLLYSSILDCPTFPIHLEKILTDGPDSVNVDGGGHKGYRGLRPNLNIGMVVVGGGHVGAPKHARGSKSAFNHIQNISYNNCAFLI